MKPIKKEDMKVGDFIYIIGKIKKRKRVFMVRIKIITLGNRINIDWWRLSEKPKDLFELDRDKEKDNQGENQGNTNMTNNNWESYNIFKLNKKEITKFNKHLILKNL